MASIDTHRPFAAPAGAGFFATLMAGLSSLKAWNDARITRQALSRLTERELDDIGLCRGDIDRIALRGLAD